MPGEDSEWTTLLEASLLALLEAADEGAVVFDRAGQCRMMGRSVGELFGVNPAGFVGKPRGEVLYAFASASSDPDGFLEALDDYNPPDSPHGASEIDIVHPRPRKLVLTAAPILRGTTPVGHLVLFRDVTRERAAELRTRQLTVRIEHLTPTDPLTGVLNRRRFHEELEREHCRSTRAWDSYAVLRIDVDEMSDINDDYGMPIGDQVLERIAECLNRSRREYDVVARYDNDEFAVLLPGADAVAARTVGARFAQAVLARDFELTDTRVTVSVGAAVWVPPSGERGDDILRRANAALLRARTGGKGFVQVDAGDK